MYLTDGAQHITTADARLHPDHLDLSDHLDDDLSNVWEGLSVVRKGFVSL